MYTYKSEEKSSLKWDPVNNKEEGFGKGQLKLNEVDSCKEKCEFEVKPVRYRDFLSTIKQIHSEEGKIAFTKGIFPRMCMNVPSTALSWGTYEIIKSLLNASSREWNSLYPLFYS